MNPSNSVFSFVLFFHKGWKKNMNKIKSTTQTETPNISNVVWSCGAKGVSFHSIRGRNTCVWSNVFFFAIS